MDEKSGNESVEAPENVLIPEIVEGEAVEDSEEVSGEFLPEETGDLIEDAVRFINFTTRKMLSDYALKIGDYLLTRFFNDDIQLASSTNRYKNVSFSRLCKRPDISLTRQDMGRMVRIAALVRIFRSIAVDVSPLTYTHQLYLTQLPHSEVKFDLVMECLNEGMPSEVLHDRIVEIKRASNLIGPGASQLPQEKIISQFSGLISRFVKKAAMPELFADRDKLYKLASDTRTQLKQTAVQWMVDIEAKCLECQFLIDHLDYIDTHPNV
ncbi:MAG: hypothetical protein WA081_15585 [Desulfosalsimonadaceae bacterium]